MLAVLAAEPERALTEVGVPPADTRAPILTPGPLTEVPLSSAAWKHRGGNTSGLCLGRGDRSPFPNTDPCGGKTAPRATALRGGRPARDPLAAVRPSDLKWYRTHCPSCQLAESPGDTLECPVQPSGVTGTPHCRTPRTKSSTSVSQGSPPGGPRRGHTGSVLEEVTARAVEVALPCVAPTPYLPWCRC